MAIFGTWKNGFFQINGVDLSDHVREMSIETSLEELPDNVHGDDTSKVRAGLENWTVNVTLLQDFASGKVDATLSGINSAGQAGVNLIMRSDSGSVSATNPNYSGNAIMSSYRPMGGPHGSNLEATATFRAAGDLTRAES